MVLKHIFPCLIGTIDFKLCYPLELESSLVGYANIGYLFNPHKVNHKQDVCLQTMKQTLATKFLNHSKIIEIHEASRELMKLSIISKYHAI